MFRGRNTADKINEIISRIPLGRLATPEDIAAAVYFLGSPENKYIQSAKLNGEKWDKSWFSHADLMNGGTLEFVMGKHPNKTWASGSDAVPPSFTME